MKYLHILTLAGSLFMAASFGNRPAPAAATSSTLKNFVYTAYPSDDPSDLGNPENYILSGGDGEDVPFCSGITHRCAVLAEDDGTGHPDFSKSYTVKLRS